MLFVACSGEPEPAPTVAPGSDPRPAEAAGSWHAGLALPVPALTPPAGGCPDADADGFADAWSCPHLPPDQADCDDGDPATTPATERFVRPGPFLMGDASPEAGWDERPVHVVFLSAYCLDRAEADGATYGAWLASTGTRPTRMDAVNPDPAGTVDWPSRAAEGLSRAEAAAFCAARGKRLPTEAQWEKAARGGCEGGADPAACDPDDLRVYPWGDAPPTCDRALHRRVTPRGPVPCDDHAGDPDALPAGDGPYGHQALAGNVWEWVADRYHPSTYPAEPRRNPGGPADGPLGTLRGGSWSTFSTNMRVANRMSDLVLGSATGVRCARFDHGLVTDEVTPVALVTLEGTVTRADGGPLSGRAIYVAAFDARDIDPRSGRLHPGRSPMAESRFDLVGEAVLAWSMEVPRGGRYRLSAALDAGTAGAVAPSGSGGMGAHPELIDATQSQGGIDITLQAAP